MNTVETPPESPGPEWRLKTIELVKTPLAFYVLIALVAEATLGVVLAIAHSANSMYLANIVGSGMVLLLFALVYLVHRLATQLPPPAGSPAVDSPRDVRDTQDIESEVSSHKSRVIGAGGPAPPPDLWYKQLRPVLYQVAHYSVPTYYLDLNLNIVDWNVAFSIAFSSILNRIRNQHVLYFIAHLENKEEVYEHAREFTDQEERGEMPLVDMEPICYESPKFGRMQFVKIAVQLHDKDGQLRAWAVTLAPRDIPWSRFQSDLLPMLKNDKLWSIYSASYDRVLSEFAPYHRLINDVVEAITKARSSVLDLGAGTGNVAAALIEKGHRVTAVENNLGMLEQLRSKKFDGAKVSVVKASVEEALAGFKEESFDGVVAVNVLYAVDDPAGCLRGIFRVLKKGGVCAFSTTHAETRLDPLLKRIRSDLEAHGEYEALRDDYEAVVDANRQIEMTIALRHTRDEYRQWAEDAGFRITKFVESTYENAVMLAHLVKP